MASVAPLPQLRRIVRSFGYAIEGLAVMLRTQPNFAVHTTAAVVALALGAVVGLSPVEFAIVVLTIALVMVVECVNTALEAVCDVLSPGFHPLVKRAKDVAAAAVLIGAFGSVVVALLIFGPHLASAFK